ncbi:MAG: hypothetical protein NZ749_04125 [bacterium]|nr:hypothetical protein [bacterium]
MKREIPPAVAILVIVAVLAIAGFFYVRHWSAGPKRISGTPPPEAVLAPPSSGQPQMPTAPPPPPGYGR